MNVNIKKLADRARLQPYYDDQERAIEEFAKQLISACINEMYSADVHLAERCHHLDCISDHINKHFGIEDIA